MLRPHRHQAAGEVLHVRLAGGVAQDRASLGRHRRHERVLGAGDARLVEEDVGADEALGLELVAVAHVDRGAELLQRQEVGIDPAPADDVAARRRQGDRPKRASIGPASRIDARIRAQSSGSSGLGLDPAGVDPHRVGADPLGAGAEVARAARACVSTSRMRGMLSSSTGPSASNVAARIGSAAFLLPAGRTVPRSGRPPRTEKTGGMAQSYPSAVSGVKRHGGACGLAALGVDRLVTAARTVQDTAGLGRADHGDLARDHCLRLRRHRDCGGRARPRSVSRHSQGTARPADRRAG